MQKFYEEKIKIITILKIFDGNYANQNKNILLPIY